MSEYPGTAPSSRARHPVRGREALTPLGNLSRATAHLEQPGLPGSQERGIQHGSSRQELSAGVRHVASRGRLGRDGGAHSRCWAWCRYNPSKSAESLVVPPEPCDESHKTWPGRAASSFSHYTTATLSCGDVHRVHVPWEHFS